MLRGIVSFHDTEKFKTPVNIPEVGIQDTHRHEQGEPKSIRTETRVHKGEPFRRNLKGLSVVSQHREGVRAQHAREDR